MHTSGTSKVSLGKGIKSFFRISKEDAGKLFQLEEDEKILQVSFGRIHKNFILQTDSNLYLTNKRLAILRGRTLITIWFEHVEDIILKPSSLAETLYMMGKFDSIVITYKAETKAESIRYWCSSGVIGTAPSPDNSKTKAVFNEIKKAIDK